jgi:hypothetical protein
MVKDEEEFYQQAFSLLKNETLRKELGKKAKEALSSQSGISDKTVQLLLQLLSENTKDEKN